MITLVAGTRPNFVKISSIIRAIESSQGLSFRFVHTGQHYDKLMSDYFFEDLKIPKPDVNLNCGGGTQATQVAQIMIEFEKELLINKPNIVVVVGDVNSTMACAIVSKKLNIKVAHVEAGIRSFDRTMPEEINRIVTDSISDYFFTTSIFANDNLLKENASVDNIFFVGNTMIDCLKFNLSNLRCPEFFDLENKKYFLMTLHRPSNVDSYAKLEKILKSVNDSSQGFPVIFPMHPRTSKTFSALKNEYKNILVVEPQKYLEFIFLIKNSLGVITDSGGVSEETTFLNIPCLTLRNSTERPETVVEGTNELIGDELVLLDPYMNKIINGDWKSGKIPALWDGLASDRIATQLGKLLCGT